MESEQFVYEKIINEIIGMIREEAYSPGSRIPSVRELAERFDCNLHTVRKAITFLCDDGVLEKRGNLGAFVRRGTNHLVGVAQSRVRIVSRRRIGVLLLPSVSDFTASLLLELEHVAVKWELQLELHIASDWTSAEELLNLMKRNACISVLLLSDHIRQTSPEAYTFLERAVLPVVLGQIVPGYEYCCHEPEELYFRFSRNTMMAQVRYFQALGFRNIACFGRYEFQNSTKDKIQLYHEIMEELGAPAIAETVGTEQDAALGVLEKWAPCRGNLAVICDDDLEAMRLAVAAGKLGWKLPEDMALIGFNNFSFGCYLNPPLTTILFPYRYLAERMLKRAIDFSEEHFEFGKIDLPIPEIIVRDSCGARARLSGEKLSGLCSSIGLRLVAESL